MGQRCPLPMVRTEGVRTKTAGSYWCWARSQAHDLWCGEVLGLRVWRDHLIRCPTGPGRATCAHCGRTSAAAHAVELFGIVRVPERVLSAFCDGRYVAAVGRAPGWVAAFFTTDLLSAWKWEHVGMRSA